MKNKELLAELIADGIHTLLILLVLVYVPGVFEFFVTLISRLQDGSPFAVISGIFTGIILWIILAYPLRTFIKNKYNMK